MNPQLKKGVLELCVLSQLTKEDKYGYELTDAFPAKCPSPQERSI